MKRFLFVVPPWTGHVNPTVTVAQHLGAAGHEVAWVGYRFMVEKLLPPGATFFPIGDGREDGWIADELARSHHVRTLESLRFHWEHMIVPLARAMRGPVEQVIADYAPSVTIVDHQAVGGALAARRRGVTWASFVTTSASVIDALAGLPKVKAWVEEQRHMLEREAELPESETPDLSRQRVIVFSTEALVGPLSQFPDWYRFVGPALGDRPDATPFPWEALAQDRPRIYVSMGTISAERSEGFYRLVVDAFRDANLQVVLLAPDGFVTDPPANFIVRPRVPQLKLLPHMHAVVSHGGHNTVCESLANALPLVVTPIRDDQPMIADQVERAGCGLRLHFGRRLTAASLRAAVERVLAEPAFKANAERVKASFAAAGGAASAARLLVELAG